MLDPKVDVVFKLLLARADNEPLLRSMIEAVVDLSAPISRVEVLNPEIPRELVAHKSIVLDLAVRCADGTLLDVEMETQPRPVLPQRVLYYWSRMYGGQLAQGQGYEKLRRAVSIVWLNGSLPVLGDRFHSTFHLCEAETRRRLSDHLELHFLTLKKRQGAQASPALDRWARFLLAPDEQALHSLAVEDHTMSKAVSELERLSRDPEARALVDWVERDRLFRRHELAVERDEGRDEGRAQGREEGLRGVARKLLATGMPPAEVARVTELSLQEIVALSPDEG